MSRIRAISKKRRARLLERADVCEAVRYRDIDCQAPGLIMRARRADPDLDAALAFVPIVCDGRRDVHEIIPRSAWPAGWLVEANCVLVCRRHHRWIDDHPDLAHAIGLHGYSWERP